MVEHYEVELADSAWDDIYNIFSYLRKNVNETTAQNVRRTLISEARKLEKTPTGYPIQHNISSEKRTFRFITKWKYKIIYHVDEEAKIVRVVAVDIRANIPTS